MEFNHTAPAVAKATIDGLMEKVVFKTARLEGTTSTFSHAYLNGTFHIATGHSACVSAENFDAEKGAEIAERDARNKAFQKLWELEGYALYKELNRG